ncbi:NTP transferase domain-containing protein [Pseudomonas capeferrum]|uniref:nucleotidyltransferase family protein n=1 Tax=Pseudomonas capeferrum TaxID=1495066 RepID=UPI0015E45829|nr:nucleotidyltransferase family protein [Pseudomonas capeferrum]MBA1200201.1 NTP transferase domain-containing protein [Pseudomonas capeferrum]
MKNPSERRRFDAIVLGADRHGNDPIAALGAAGCKALTPIAGVPMLHRVLGALTDSALVDQITLVGPSSALLEKDAHFRSLVSTGRAGFLPPLATPAASVSRALARRTRWPVLVTTADHALLRADIVDYFLTQSARLDCDVTVAVTPLAAVLERFPGTARTAIRLKGGPYCGSNLFAFLTPEGAKVAQYWKGMEQARKHPRQVVARALGTWATARYLLGQLSLDHALAQLSKALGIRIGAVVMPFPEAAVDVDSTNDFALVERTLREMAENHTAPAT